jgi:hypothetical protein
VSEVRPMFPSAGELAAEQRRCDVERIAIEIAIAWAVFRRLPWVRDHLSTRFRHNLDELERLTRDDPRRRTI